MRYFTAILVKCGLRDYGIPPVVWDDPGGCEHEWGGMCPEHHPGQVPQTKTGANTIESSSAGGQTAGSGQFCIHCNAWRGSLGLEPTPDLFVKHLVEVFRGVWRVLRPDGVCFVNLGDSYAGSTMQGGDGSTSTLSGSKVWQHENTQHLAQRDLGGLKPKDLIMIPARVALALQADGWWLRSNMPWVKRSAMPESATDRPASALEYMFMLTKSAKYYFDMDAVKVNSGANTHAQGKGIGKKVAPFGEGIRHNDSFSEATRNATKADLPPTRNFRNTDLFYQSIKPPHGLIFAGDEPVGIDCNPQAMKAAHFATFPEKLIEPLILAGTSAKGCCPECGAPWVRVVEKQYPEMRTVKSRIPNGQSKQGILGENRFDEPIQSKTTGWRPGCDCHAIKSKARWEKMGWEEKRHYWKEIECDPNLLPIPCTVLDIFGGAMTSAIVSEKHDRRWVMIELSKPYIDEIGIPRIKRATEQPKLPGF